MEVGKVYGSRGGGGGGGLKASGAVWMLVSPGGQGGSRRLGQGLGHEDGVKCKLGSKA